MNKKGQTYIDTDHSFPVKTFGLTRGQIEEQVKECRKVIHREVVELWFFVYSIGPLTQQGYGIYVC